MAKGDMDVCENEKAVMKKRSSLPLSLKVIYGCHFRVTSIPIKFVIVSHVDRGLRILVCLYEETTPLVAKKGEINPRLRRYYVQGRSICGAYVDRHSPSPRFTYSLLMSLSRFVRLEGHDSMMIRKDPFSGIAGTQPLF